MCAFCSYPPQTSCGYQMGQVGFVLGTLVPANTEITETAVLCVLAIWVSE